MLHTINRKLTVVYILDKCITIGLFLLCAIGLFVLNPTVVVIVAIIVSAYWFNKGYKDALLFLFDCLTHSKSTEFVYYSNILTWDHFDWHNKLCCFELIFFTNKQKKIVVTVPLELSFDTPLNTLNDFLPPCNKRVEICYYKYSKVLDYWR